MVGPLTDEPLLSVALTLNGSELSLGSLIMVMALPLEKCTYIYIGGRRGLVSRCWTCSCGLGAGSEQLIWDLFVLGVVRLRPREV